MNELTPDLIYYCIAGAITGFIIKHWDSISALLF